MVKPTSGKVLFFSFCDWTFSVCIKSNRVFTRLAASLSAFLTLKVIFLGRSQFALAIVFLLMIYHQNRKTLFDGKPVGRLAGLCISEKNHRCNAINNDSYLHFGFCRIIVIKNELHVDDLVNPKDIR